MVFSSLLFLCRFLPIVLLVYFIAPVSLRNLVLFISSLIFYAWGEPAYIFIMLFSTVFDYLIGRWIGYSKSKNNKKVAKFALAISVIGNLSILFLFKYSNLVVDTANSIFNSDLSSLDLALPIGISFYTFQTMSYSIDVYRGEVDVQKNIINFGAYVSLFPQLIAGPIVRYKTIEKELNYRAVTLQSFSEGIVIFVTGLGKKVLLANTIGQLFTEISGYDTGLTTASAWIGIIAYAFQIYFDFSGYSDMAIGLGRMFGFHFLENFDYPYQSKSITEFWRRWHISLGTFFREYVYYPLGGNRKGKPRQIFNILVVWMLTGFWHGASWNFVLWGLYYAVLLVAEKLFLNKLLSKLPSVIGNIYTILSVIIGWSIFTYIDMADGSYYLSTMIGLSGEGLYNSSTIYYFTSFALVFAVCILASTNYPKRIVNAVVKDRTNLKIVLSCIYVLVILTISIAFLVSDTYNPFLYFRF